MPLGFSDILKTTAQFTNGVNKAIVSTDDTYGGVRSAISDWTQLHLSTYTTGTGGTSYTFQDDGTVSARGLFKDYSTLFYVVDGRALVQNDSATENFIRLNASTGLYVPSEGVKFTLPSSGDPEPEYWVLKDVTQIGGAGTGTDKLPKFTVSGSAGSYTAIPAGYIKFSELINANVSESAISVDVTGTNEPIALYPVFIGNTNGGIAQTLYVDNAGSMSYTPSTNTLTLNALSSLSFTTGSLSVTGTASFGGGISLGTSSNNILLNYSSTPSGLSTLTVPEVTGTLAVTDDISSAISALSLGTISTQDANSVAITGGAINNTPIGATTPNTGAFTTFSATSGVFTSNVSIAGNLTVSGNVVQQNSTTVIFEDAYLNLNVPINDGTIVNATVNSNAGFFFTKQTSNSQITQYSAFHYDNSADQFKFTRHTDSVTGLVASADNLAALKFNVNDTITAVSQSSGTTTVSDPSHTSTNRSLGGVSKCTVDITTAANDAGANWAPAEAAANGYIVRHNLDTTSVFVVALKTHDASGNAIDDPQVVYCNYLAVDNNTARVTLGIVSENEKYDVLVIG
jgi:hypothetical protein